MTIEQMLLRKRHALMNIRKCREAAAAEVRRLRRVRAGVPKRRRCEPQYARYTAGIREMQREIEALDRQAAELEKVICNLAAKAEANDRRTRKARRARSAINEKYYQLCAWKDEQDERGRLSREGAEAVCPSEGSGGQDMP